MNEYEDGPEPIENARCHQCGGMGIVDKNGRTRLLHQEDCPFRALIERIGR